MADERISAIRRLLFENGYCADGDLVAMVGRALREAEERGRNVETQAQRALQDADSALPSDWEGTVAERVRRLRQGSAILP
jgi:hypothetical protein